MGKSKFKTAIAVGIAVTGVMASSVTAQAVIGKPLTKEQTELGTSISDPAILKTIKENRAVGMNCTTTKQQMKEMGGDPNREEYQVEGDTSEIRISRYTHPDTSPYTGLYLETDSKGRPKTWLVLDKNGFYDRDVNNRQIAWDDSKMCADYLWQSGANYNKGEAKYYLGHQTTKDNALITYMVINDWLQVGPSYYRSNEKGVCYRNQWFKDSASGKWYYFGDDCVMVTNKLIDGYYLDKSGAWQE